MLPTQPTRLGPRVVAKPFTVVEPVDTLAALEVGQKAVVTAVQSSRFRRLRLLEMGLLPGTEVQILRRAPMGDPIELRLRDYSLSIRRDEAEAVVVEREVAT